MDRAGRKKIYKLTSAESRRLRKILKDLGPTIDRLLAKWDIRFSCRRLHDDSQDLRF